jgi:hypothetical protein
LITKLDVKNLLSNRSVTRLFEGKDLKRHAIKLKVFFIVVTFLLFAILVAKTSAAPAWSVQSIDSTGRENKTKA